MNLKRKFSAIAACAAIGVGGVIAAAPAFAYNETTTVANGGYKSLKDGTCNTQVWSTSSYARTQSSTNSGCGYIRARAYVVNSGVGYYSSWQTRNNPSLNQQVFAGPFSTVTSGQHRASASS